MPDAEVEPTGGVVRCECCGEALVYQGLGEWSCPEDHDPSASHIETDK